MVLIQNQGKRTFILAEGKLAPLGSVQVTKERATQLCSEYPEFKILEVIKSEPIVEKVVEPEHVEEKAAETEHVEEKVDEEALAYEDMSRPSLMQLCKNKGIKISVSAKKEDLIDLLKGE